MLPFRGIHIVEIEDQDISEQVVLFTMMPDL